MLSPSNEGGSVANEMLQRPGQMGLVRVPGLICRVDQRNALHQKRGGLFGALDLLNCLVGEPGRQDKAAPDGAQRHLYRVMSQDRLHHGIRDQHMLANQALNKGLNILIVRDRPAGVSQMKGCLRGQGQERLLIQQALNGECGQKSAERKRDPEPLGPFGLSHRGRSGQRSLYRNMQPVVPLEKE